MIDFLRTLAIIPAYNEGKHIGGVIQKTLKYLPVLVVDDGSSDDTVQQAKAAGADVLHQVPNQGKGAALMAGFRKAVESGYNSVVMLDADGQHDPDDIPHFLQAFELEQADLIIGQRKFQDMPLLRRTANSIGMWIFSWAIGQPIPDNQSGYRLLSQRIIEATLRSKETNFEFEVEMIVRCVQLGYRLSWVQIKTIYGDEKSHIRPLRHVYHFVRMVMQTRRVIRKGQRS